MALLWCDSFDHYNTAQILSKWTTWNGSSSITGNGRWVTQGWQSNDLNKYVQKDFGTSYPALIAGMAFYCSAYSDSSVPIMSFLDSGTHQMELRMQTTGRVYVTRNGTYLGGTTNPIPQNVWNYYEMKTTFHDTTGSVVFRLNGTEITNLTNQDTKNTANASANQFRLGNTAGGAGVFIWDDVYVLTTTGSAPTNDFLGDVRVQCIFPNGNGATSMLVGQDGNSTDNYLLVDETTAANDDTDYVESSTVNDKDTYAYGNLTPTTGAIAGLQLVPRLRKTDAGVRTMKSISRLSGTEEDSADKNLTASYIYYPDIRETKPGGGAWSISDVNSAEFGIKVTS